MESNQQRSTRETTLNFKPQNNIKKERTVVRVLKPNKSNANQTEEKYIQISKKFYKNFTRPEPTGDEIELSDNKVIISKTDEYGVIEYGNDYFVTISGYKEEELIGSPHNIIRHPDMPKIIFKLMWERLEHDKDIYALVKNLAKSGDHYWVLTKFDIKTNKHTNAKTYFATRRKAPREAVLKISKLYKKLIKIERERGIEASDKYLKGYLEVEDLTYDQYIDKLTNNTGLKKSWFKIVIAKLFT